MPDLETDVDRRYSRCFAFTHREEGGLADRPLRDDPGGVTNHGMSLRLARSLGTMFDLDGSGVVDREDILLVTPDHTRWAFFELFWRSVHGNRLWPGLDLCAFDMSVHSGPGRATRFMQSALRVTADGVWGPMSNAAMMARWRDPVGQAQAIERFCAARAAWLEGLPNAAANPGWVGRVLRVRDAAQRMMR